MKICKYHHVPIIKKETKSGALRDFCGLHQKFLYKDEVIEITEQIWQILKRLNKMDEYLGEIWDIAFHSNKYPKMQKGIPEHGLGNVFIALHEAQRSVCEWEQGIIIPRHRRKGYK